MTFKEAGPGKEAVIICPQEDYLRGTIQGYRKNPVIKETYFLCQL